MNISISGKVRNYIFIVVIVITFFSLIAALSVATNQEKAYRDNYVRYEQALSLMQEKKYAKAQELFNQLNSDSRHSFQVLYKFGICSAGIGNYGEAVNFMKSAQETRPALLKNQTFLIEYGQFLFMLGNFDMAKIYLLESKKYDVNPSDLKVAESFLKQIETKEKGGR